MKPSMKKLLKVTATATLSLAILGSTLQPQQASADTNLPFDLDYDKHNYSVAQKNLKATQKKTKNYTAKQRVNYYNKVLDKIVKDSKKSENKELQILSIYQDLQSKLYYNFDSTKPIEYKKYYHKDPGVYAINSGYSQSKGYAYALRDALKKAGYKTDIVSFKDWDGMYYWNVIKLGGKYYHLDAFDSDQDNIPKNHGMFLINGKEMYRFHDGYKLKKLYKNTDYKYSGFNILDTGRILKETKTHFYSLNGIGAITKVSKKGKGEILYETNTGSYFVAEKNGFVYGFDYKKNVFFKIQINKLISIKASPNPYTSPVETITTLHPKSNGYTLTDKTITFYNKNKKKVTYTLGK